MVDMDIMLVVTTIQQQIKFDMDLIVINLRLVQRLDSRVIDRGKQPVIVQIVQQQIDDNRVVVRREVHQHKVVHLRHRLRQVVHLVVDETEVAVRRDDLREYSEG